MSKKIENLARIREAFDPDALARVCAMHETDFATAYGMDVYQVDQPAPDDFFAFGSFGEGDGAGVLGVAHLDTVGHHEARRARFVETEAGLVVFSRALDDRLGAYVILELLPALGIHHDVLLTVGEENGRSTAGFFDTSKEYNWMIEFDRGGTDVVMYQYDDDDMRDLVKASGARPADGIFSDIAFMEHLEIKGFNWGVGYREYHEDRAHAFLEDTFRMVGYYLDFHEANGERKLPHEPSPMNWFGGWDVRFTPEEIDDWEEDDDLWD